MTLFPQHLQSYRSGIRQSQEDADQHQPETPHAKLRRVWDLANAMPLGSAEEAYWRGYAAELDALIELDPNGGLLFPLAV